MTDTELICTMHWFFTKTRTTKIYIKLSTKSTRIKNSHIINMFANRTDTRICDI